jgi:hypothetical protein
MVLFFCFVCGSKVWLELHRTGMQMLMSQCIVVNKITQSEMKVAFFS